MRSYPRLAVAIALAGLVVATMPSLAGAKAPKSGTWTFTDMTPNPTVFGECMNSGVPTGPSDANTVELKVTKKVMTLTTTAHNQLDWAAQITDAGGAVLQTWDGTDPTTKENISILLAKGKYLVSYCNWLGEPEITVDWELK